MSGVNPVPITYRPEFGLHWPNTENDMVYSTMLNRVTDVDVAARHCRTLGVAVQAGGFIGMWPVRLHKLFERVYTFEPVPHLYQCLVANTAHLPGVIQHRAALSDHLGLCDINYKTGGGTRVVEQGRETVPAVSIDSLKLLRCDAIFLDVERHELEVLNGAKKTIEKFHPMITLEIKEDTRDVYDKYMAERDYEPVTKVHGDVIYKWGKWT